MKMTADVIIIGGAVMGASCAFWLTRMSPGLDVLVIERDVSFARAGTALSVASVRQQFSAPVNVALSRFGVQAIRDFAGLMGPAGGVPSLGLRENGYLFVTTRPEQVAVMEELAAMQRACGAGTVVLTPEGVAARFPWLNVADLAAGSFGPRDEGWFDNMGLLAGFRNAARAQGARFLTAEAVGLRLEAGRVTGVQVAGHGVFSAPSVIAAAGTRAATVAGWAGVTVPVEPRKRTVFVIDAPGARHADAPLLIDRGFYLRPEGEHWITATVPDADSACDVNDFDPDLHLFDEVIWEQLWHRAPGFDAVKVIRHWVGHYDYNTLDQNAILGAHPAVPNLLFCTGFSGHGLQQAPGVGRGMAELALTGAFQALDLRDLSFDRVLAGRPMVERAVV